MKNLSGDVLIEPYKINWKSKFAKDKKRYEIVYDDYGIMIEVHDLKTNDVWFKVQYNWWMKL